MPVKKAARGRTIKDIQQEFGSGQGTPPPQRGREHIEIQTEEYIEHLTDKPPEYEIETQTDFYIDRPLPRLFVPKKTGTDRETQIYQGDLFDFDEEVDQILEVLVNKSLEQSRMEVLEEEELKKLKAEHQRYEQRRFAELAEVQRLEAKERRQVEELERRDR